MADLYIRFARWLYSHEDWDLLRPHGPHFTRWLPNGEADAIRLQAPRTEAPVFVWFERRGFVRADGGGSEIQYDPNRNEFDNAVMPRQAILDAGGMFGRTQLRAVDSATITALENDAKGNPDYEKLGKRVTDLLCVSVGRFVDLLRVNYGQYWLEVPEAWDARKCSLGSYCSIWNLKWSLSGEAGTWTDFRPNGSEVYIVANYQPNHSYAEYITQGDWAELARIYASDYKPTVAAYLLNRAHRLLARGETRYALIECTSSLELAAKDYVRKKCAPSMLNTVLPSFDNLTAPVRMALVSSLVPAPGVAHADIDLAVRAIDIRNKMIHEGGDLPADTATAIEGVLRIVTVLDGGPVYKFPSLWRGNAIFPEEPETEQAAPKCPGP